MRVSMNHTGFVVKDLERSRRFYVDGLGLEELAVFEFQSDELGQIVGYDNAKIYASMLAGSDGHVLEILQYMIPETVEADPEHQYPRAQTGASHLAFYVEDAMAMWTRLCDMGGQPMNPPVEVLPGVLECYMQDPDGNWIEITQDNEHNRSQFKIRYNTSSAKSSPHYVDRSRTA